MVVYEKLILKSVRVLIFVWYIVNIYEIVFIIWDVINSLICVVCDGD